MKRDGQPTKRETELAIARVCGFEQDTARFVRLLCERRCTSEAALREVYSNGFNRFLIYRGSAGKD